MHKGSICIGNICAFSHHPPTLYWKKYMKYQILTKLLEPNFLRALIFVDQRFCQHPSLTTTQLNLNLLSWARLESDVANHPTTKTQCQQYLSYYWPDFDETLKVDSGEHLEQITSVMVTFFRLHLCWWHLSILGISQLLLIRFWQRDYCKCQQSFSTWYQNHSNYNIMGFDIIEINLVWNYFVCLKISTGTALKLT